MGNGTGTGSYLDHIGNPNSQLPAVTAPCQVSLVRCLFNPAAFAAPKV